MFYEALLASGVPKKQARIMFYAVYTFGPRWSKQDPGRLCRGNLTPLCQYMKFDPGVIDNSLKNDPVPRLEKTPEELLKIYMIEPDLDGKLNVFRTEQYADPEAKKDVAEIEAIVETWPAENGADAKEIDSDIARIVKISDERHPAEGILLQCETPEGCGDR